MGKKARRLNRRVDYWDRMDDESDHDESETSYNDEGPDTIHNGRNKTSVSEKNHPKNNRSSDNSDPHEHPNFDEYLQAIEELHKHMSEGQNAMKKVRNLYTNQQREIRTIAKTQQQLNEMKDQCERLSEALDTVQSRANEKLAQVEKTVKAEKLQLQKDQEALLERENSLKVEKAKFDKRAVAIDAEQKKLVDDKFQELEDEYNKRNEELKTKLEQESKRRQESDKKVTMDLEANNQQLSHQLDDQKKKLRESQDKLFDAEKLKDVYRNERDVINERLKLAENEFKLNVGTEELRKKQFNDIRQNIQNISSHCFTDLPGDEAGYYSLHQEIASIDKEFETVPISKSRTSVKLRTAHVERIIATQLQQIICKPFSSEATQRTRAYESLLREISDGVKAHYNQGSAGIRAARMFSALAVRGLQSLESSATPPRPNAEGRAQEFKDAVMSILAPLTRQTITKTLEQNLLSLASSAISMWDDAQTDACEIIFDSHLEPLGVDGWHDEAIGPDEAVIVLFPRVISCSCSQDISSRRISPPGSWADQEPEFNMQEICVHPGSGLARSSDVVQDGEDEQDEIEAREHQKKIEEKRRMLEEHLKSLDGPLAGSRKMSVHKRESDSGISHRGKPSNEAVQSSLIGAPN